MSFITKMKDLEYYTRIGKESFELRGTELRQWVSDQMKSDAEEAQKVRQFEAEEAEKVRQYEVELARAKEEERKHEAEEAEKVRQHEY